ncbi:replication-relaxation family protein [Actinokineospora sp. NBRC 105648]|uniref:replication-relaxation family protein n=1 Tax=Actinokineospora sp. NBRC 105648 TaxID=3032206 RepID=UPI0024A10D3F|nr:replication-relaxation family protein [Actinokineospora sp. NBRC 105648]GLZ37860.1 hypothetical protein Acsp05_14840 [Actinokineospora sp. NBRC 105648]
MITNPPNQRSLRGHMPQRTSPRAATSAEHHANLARHLQPRDLWLARMLHEHKVLTSHQIAALAWPSVRAANLRLLQLYRWRMVDRWQPFVTSGSAPMHYVLDTAGAVAVAREAGLDPADLDYRRDREMGRAYSLRLAHTTGVNSVFAALVNRARHHHDLTVAAWWSETRCNRLFGDVVRPDGYGRVTSRGHDAEWFLEFDFGTETLTTLANKLARYEKLATTTGIATPVLVWLPSTRRETGARAALLRALQALDQPHLVPVATTATDVVAPDRALDPSATRWQALTPATSARLDLIDLTLGWPTSSPATTPTSSTPPAPPGPLAAPPPMPPPQPNYPLSRSGTR